MGPEIVVTAAPLTSSLERYRKKDEINPMK
jgi:hypothetical protein